MASFDLFFPLIVADEKLIVTDDPNDSGGYSIAGISAKYYPNDPVVVRAKALGLKHGQWADELLPLVKNFYRRSEWDAYEGDKIINQEAINTIASRGVNVGSAQSIRMIQAQIGVLQTGVMDNATIAKINELNPYP